MRFNPYQIRGATAGPMPVLKPRFFGWLARCACMAANFIHY
jgi:hypothetical protein